MSLTEDKCRDSLSNLYYILDGKHCYGCIRDGSKYCKTCNIKEDLSIIRKLINEHFDNPPLKFKEIEGMTGEPIWDNKLKKWSLLRENLMLFSGGKELEFITLKYNRSEFDFYVCNFEENRFYRKQVD